MDASRNVLGIQEEILAIEEELLFHLSLTVYIKKCWPDEFYKLPYIIRKLGNFEKESLALY